MQKDKDSQKWQFPSLDLLDEPLIENENLQNTEKNSKVIINVLKSHDIEVSINPDEIKVGPTFTQYPLDVKSPILISKIIKLEKEITLAVDSISGTIRIAGSYNQIPNLYIEIPNEKRQKVYFKTTVKALKEKKHNSGLVFPLGLDVEYNTFNTDIKKWPNILIAGSTGTGKSVLLHNIIISMLFTKTPDDVKLILIDPKLGVEFPDYKDIPYLLKPVITDMNEAADTLSWLVEEAKRREDTLSKANVGTGTEYNIKVGKTELPDILVINDTMEEVMIDDAVESETNIIKIARISQKVGIHQIYATSRPYASVFTGLIRANITTRAAFRTQGQIDSMVTIDQPGAEKLLGKGDMLFLPSDSIKPSRIQVPCVSYEETKRVVDFVKKQSKFLS